MYLYHILTLSCSKKIQGPHKTSSFILGTETIKSWRRHVISNKPPCLIDKKDELLTRNENLKMWFRTTGEWFFM